VVWRQALLVALVVVLLATTALVVSSGAAVSAPEVLFIGSRGGTGASVLAIHADGSGLRVVALPAEGPGGTARYTPMVSRRGDYVALGSRAGMEVVPTAGGRLVRITHGDDHPISWSPDGRWILFGRRPLFSDVYVVAPDGSQLRKLTTKANAERLYNARLWTPDSKHVLAEDGPGVVAFDLTGRRQRPFPNTADSQDVAFSPDGRWVVMSRIFDPDFKYAIQIARADFTQPLWLTLPNGYGLFEPAWSPDSGAIAYVDEFGDGTPGAAHNAIYAPYTIRLFSRDRKYLGKLDNDPRYLVVFPQWSPDGHQIVFEQADKDLVHGSLWIGDVRTGHVRKLYGRIWLLRPTWLPR
jgi:Tol biopolymer transport system component